MTCCHSFSFILIRILSCVMPALFTNTRGSPTLALTSSMNASMLPVSVTLSTRPWPPWGDSASAIPEAPASLVAVPTTIKPAWPRLAAMAAPIPRLAPVTMATLEGDSVTLQSPSRRGSDFQAPPREYRLLIGRSVSPSRLTLYQDRTP